MLRRRLFVRKAENSASAGLGYVYIRTGNSAKKDGQRVETITGLAYNSDEREIDFKMLFLTSVKHDSVHYIVLSHFDSICVYT